MGRESVIVGRMCCIVLVSNADLNHIALFIEYKPTQTAAFETVIVGDLPLTKIARLRALGTRRHDGLKFRIDARSMLEDGVEGQRIGLYLRRMI